MIYLDTSYIAKCYLHEPGSPEILEWLEGNTGLTCCLHGRLELVSAFKRHHRESRLRANQLKQVLTRLKADEEDLVWNWIPVTETMVREACDRVAALPKSTCIRSADALHLTCAATHGFREVHTHDRHMLAAAKHFGVQGCDILPA